DVLPRSGDDDLLLAPGDVQVAVLVEPAQIPGVEPAVADRIGGGRWVVPVCGENHRACEEYLRVFGDPDGGTVHGLAHRADALRAGPVGRHRRGRLGQAVPLVDGHADAAEEVPQPFAQRASPGDRRIAPATEGRLEFAVDQLVEQRVFDAQQYAGAAGVLGPAPFDGRGLRGPEDRR